jgi:outer membrane receptor for monomeric catechols
VKIFFEDDFLGKINRLMRSQRELIFFAVFLLFNVFEASSQSDTIQQREFFQASMDRLLQKQSELNEEGTVKVTTQTSTSLRETPGIVTVITREDIEDSGALDLIDLLRSVPGIEFGIDV